jgi:hypothetical protein
MPAPVSTPHCPFDRLWQPGHPFRPRRSRCRRWTMALLLIFMSGIISSYWYLTDPVRIKAMSQSYLSQLAGGRVQIGSASLTVFEGLKLSRVQVKVDNSNAADSQLFFADVIEIQYDPASLLRGDLEATRIIATGAKVNLVEDPTAGKWNYQRLHKAAGKPSNTRSTGEAEHALPQLVLRDAQVQYSEMQGGKRIPRGSMAVGGRFFLSPDHSIYSFQLQSRGESEGVGPVVNGQVTLKTGRVDATLSNLQFGPDVEAMLPRDVRDFWQAHKVAGALDIKEFSYTPATKTHHEKFRLQTELNHVTLSFHSEEFDAPPMAQPSMVGKPSLLAYVSKLQGQVRRMVYVMHALPQRPPIVVNDVTGEFFFDENGISFNRVAQTIAGATLLVSGKMEGYSPDAPVWVRFESTPGELIDIPEHPDFLPSLPDPLQQAYSMLKPHGTGTMWAEINRAKPNSFPQVTGEINIVNGAFDCIFFPYPVREAKGKVVFSPDPTGKFELVQLEDIRGKGVLGGPNENGELMVSGWVGANDPDVGCRIHARASNIKSEPAIFAAFPPPVRKAVAIFSGPGEEKFPRFAGGFDCSVFVPPGHNMRPIVSVDLDFKDGSGKLVAFPYPLENLHGQITIRDGYLTIDSVDLHHDDTTLNVTGKVTWPTDLPAGVDVIAKPYLKLTGRNVPIDKQLLNVLPPEASHWIRTAGATGVLDVDGDVTPKAVITNPTDCVSYDMDVTVRNAAAHPINTDFAISDAGGKLRLHPDRLEVLDLHGKRGSADLFCTGDIDWSSQTARVKVDARARRLVLDKATSQLLPDEAKQAWVTLNPQGTVDADLLFHFDFPAVAPTAGVASIQVPAGSVVSLASLSSATSVSPAGSVPSLPISVPRLDDFRVTLRPTDVTVTPAPLPYRLDHCNGEITITPDNITVIGIHARHGNATVAISGKSITSNPNDWDLNLKATDMPADEDLRRALPLPMRQVIEQLKYKGDLSVDLTTFRYRGEKPDPDIDMSGVLSAKNGSVDVAVPVDQMNGSLRFDAAVRNGKLTAFRGDVDMPLLSLANRPLKNFKASAELPPGSDVLHVSNVRGELAGGELDGQMDLKFPDVGPSSYLLDFKVKNADLREMAQQVAGKGQEIRGQASASLALQGEWADPTTRRGRGDVLIAGKEMYQIPLLLGLLEVTNLSLPGNNSFTEGTARYLVEGNRITFQQVEMRSASMVMSGNGWLDFGSKQVRMNFTTDNPNLPKLPLIGNLLQGAKNELLQIQVRGSVQSPKVSAAAMHTFTTTVDEVFSGGDKR